MIGCFPTIWACGFVCRKTDHLCLRGACPIAVTWAITNLTHSLIHPGWIWQKTWKQCEFWVFFFFFTLFKKSQIDTFLLCILLHNFYCECSIQCSIWPSIWCLRIRVVGFDMQNIAEQQLGWATSSRCSKLSTVAGFVSLQIPNLSFSSWWNIYIYLFSGSFTNFYMYIYWICCNGHIPHIITQVRMC
jgi:hypothetical protein